MTCFHCFLMPCFSVFGLCICCPSCSSLSHDLLPLFSHALLFSVWSLHLLPWLLFPFSCPASIVFSCPAFQWFVLAFVAPVALPFLMTCFHCFLMPCFSVFGLCICCPSCSSLSHDLLPLFSHALLFSVWSLHLLPQLLFPFS